VPPRRDTDPLARGRCWAPRKCSRRGRNVRRWPTQPAPLGAGCIGRSSESDSDASSGGGAEVNTRTATAPLTSGYEEVTVFAACRDNEVPVSGYPLVDGEDLYGNPKAFYSTNGTGERSSWLRTRRPCQVGGKVKLAAR